MLEKCNKCGKEFLTEADPYVVIPWEGELNCGCFFKKQNDTKKDLRSKLDDYLWKKDDDASPS